MSRRCERVSCPGYLHVMATIAEWRGRSRDTVWRFGLPFSTLARSHRLQGRTRQRARVCVCVCVRARARARARACVHGAIGVGRGAQNAAGRQALPVFSLRRRAFEILLGLVLQFVVHFFFASVVLNAMKDMHMWRSSSAVSGSRARAHLILRVLFVVLRHVVVRGGTPTRPPLPTHDRQVGVEVSDREKLRQTVAALGASTGANKDMGRCDLRLERSLHLGQGRVFVEGGAAEPDRLCRSREQTRRGGEKHAVAEACWVARYHP